MINRINPNSVNSGVTNKKPQPQFKGTIGESALAAATSAIALCEINPMVNVSVLDLSTAIIPRTIVESETNPYAGFEAFRRESSGLVINCLIPGLIVAGIAKMLGGKIMGSQTKLTDCWANGDTIKLVTDKWEKASDVAIGKDGKTLFSGDKQKAKVYNAIKNILDSTEGVDGEITKSFKGMDFEDSIKNITENVFKKELSKETSIIDKLKAGWTDKKEVKKAYSEIVGKTKVAENIKIAGFNGYFSQNLESIITNSPKLLKELVGGKTVNIADFTARANKLVTTKSLLGLGVIIPLALSAQPINRWITEKTSGKKGAPIYKDFSQSQDKTQTKEEKTGLLRQKLVSVGAMVGVAALSMMKKPSLEMLKFKGIFPNMDQARIISTVTFASRMMSSQDKNDLREATVRDIATFSAFYFLGDYVAKGIATIIQKTTGTKLINEKAKLKKGANRLDKIAHWTKDTALKSSAELIEGRPKQMRALCQLGNIAFSLVALGLLIPKLNRKKTDQEREKELKEMGVDKNTIDKYYPAFAMNMNDPNAKLAFAGVATSKP